jgi:large subunit ribosomal protein L21e
MVNKKSLRDRGKISLSKYFQELTEGDSVTVIKEKSLASFFPKRLQGRTGKVVGKRGKSYILKINDQKKEKEFLIEPIHLLKIKN